MAFYTTRQLAKEAARRGRKVTSEYIRRQCKAGTIMATKLGRDWLIRDGAATAWLELWLA